MQISRSFIGYAAGLAGQEQVQAVFHEQWQWRSTCKAKAVHKSLLCGTSMSPNKPWPIAPLNQLEHKSIKEQHILIAYVPLLMHVHSLLLILLQTKVFAQFTYELRIRLFVWSTGLKINGKQYLGFVRWYKECCAALFLHERMWLATMNPVGATFIQTCA